MALKSSSGASSPEELEGFDECFICGTGAEVTPVSEIGPYKFTPGKISRKLIEAYARETQPQEDEIAADISL